jgi:hypothetical protein
MKYVKELDSISDYPETFLKELDKFFINTNLSTTDRQKLVDIIKRNLYTANFSTTEITKK